MQGSEPRTAARAAASAAGGSNERPRLWQLLEGARAQRVSAADAGQDAASSTDDDDYAAAAHAADMADGGCVEHVVAENRGTRRVRAAEVGTASARSVDALPHAKRSPVKVAANDQQVGAADYAARSVQQRGQRADAGAALAALAGGVSIHSVKGAAAAALKK